MTGFLAFSISFSGYRFAVRSLFLTRKRYYINIRQPLDIFDKYYDEKRKFIEKIKMDDLVDEWFNQKRVLDRLELE